MVVVWPGLTTGRGSHSSCRNYGGCLAWVDHGSEVIHPVEIMVVYEEPSDCMLLSHISLTLKTNVRCSATGSASSTEAIVLIIKKRHF